MELTEQKKPQLINDFFSQRTPPRRQIQFSYHSQPPAAQPTLPTHASTEPSPEGKDRIEDEVTVMKYSAINGPALRASNCYFDGGEPSSGYHSPQKIVH